MCAAVGKAFREQVGFTPHVIARQSGVLRRLTDGVPLSAVENAAAEAVNPEAERLYAILPQRCHRRRPWRRQSSILRKRIGLRREALRRSVLPRQHRLRQGHAPAGWLCPEAMARNFRTLYALLAMLRKPAAAVSADRRP